MSTSHVRVYSVHLHNLRLEKSEKSKFQDSSLSCTHNVNCNDDKYDQHKKPH